MVRRGDRVLLCLRPAHKRHGGRWEFPGGKIREGESRWEAARRELAEELAVTVIRMEADAVAIRDPDSAHVIEFVAAEIEGTPRPLEHARIEWVSRSSVHSYPLAPADREFAARCLEGGAGGRDRSDGRSRTGGGSDEPDRSGPRPAAPP